MLRFQTQGTTLRVRDVSPPDAVSIQRIARVELNARFSSSYGQSPSTQWLVDHSRLAQLSIVFLQHQLWS